jgi:hypothetical protein
VNFKTCTAPGHHEASNMSPLSTHLIIFCVTTFLNLPSFSISIATLAETPQLLISTVTSVKNGSKLGCVSTWSRTCTLL